MGSPDDLDKLLSLGSEREVHPQHCVDDSALDEADLLAYRRHRLTETKREEVETHLVDCAYCRDLVASIPARRPARRWPVFAGIAAAAAVLLLTIATPRPVDPLGPYTIAEIRGAVATHRATPTPRSQTFRPESQVAIKVEPSAGRPAAMVRVFRVDGDVLVPVEQASIEPGVGGVFWVKGSGGALFGESAGSKRLMIVAADEGADLSRISGRSPASAQAVTTRTSWMTVIVDYQLH